MGKPVYKCFWCQIISALGCAECDWRCSVPLLGVLRWVGWVGWVAELKNWLYLGTVSGWGTHLNHPIYNHPIYGMESQKNNLKSGIGHPFKWTNRDILFSTFQTRAATVEFAKNQQGLGLNTVAANHPPCQVPPLATFSSPWPKF